MSKAKMWECFVAGIKALRDHGWQQREQKAIAKDLGYTTTHISQVFQGKRKPSETLQEGLAKEYGINVEDVIRIGRNIIEGYGFFPFYGQVEQLPSNSEAQAHRIVELTNRQFGIEGMLLGYQPEKWNEFMDGRISMATFYESYAGELKTIVAALEKRHKRFGAKLFYG
jgi:transcriptional regulator with XRE-family HTH domain